MDLNAPSLVSRIKAMAKIILPVRVRHQLLLWQQRISCWPPAGGVRFGSLRRVSPVSRRFGFGRGLSVDRHYIEAFLTRCARDIQGRVLEIGDDAYTRRFGGQRVSGSDVLHVVPGHPGATMIADLTAADHLPSDIFDCIICTQTLQYIFEVPKAIHTLYRMLKPGGVLLATVPGISQISRYDMDHWGEHWRFTSLSAQRLFGERFGTEHVTVEARGNVLVAVAFLHGLAAQELRVEELHAHDRDYEVLITVRAVKAAQDQTKQAGT